MEGRNVIRSLIKEEVNALFENMQMADKVYFNTGKLSQKVEDFDIVYEQGNIMIAKVESPDGIKAIGCNSLWCFTYGSGFDTAYRMWGNYSHNDIVYVIIDFGRETDDSGFMHVLIRPLTDENGKFLKFEENDDDKHPLFNMANENWFDPYERLGKIFGNNYKNIVKKIMNFEN